MSKIIWDQTGERKYETGVKKGVLYPKKEDGTFDKGVAWNGITAVSQSPSGAEATPLYADDIKYLNLVSAEEFGASIEAYTYPDEFAECDGSKELAPGIKVGQQARKEFGFSYTTTLGNDTQGSDYGYIIHLVYNALAAPSEKSYNTINDSPEAITLSWDVTTTPIAVPNMKPTAHLEIDSTKTTAAVLKAIEDKIYGTDSDEPELPTPSEIIALIASVTNAAG